MGIKENPRFEQRKHGADKSFEAKLFDTLVEALGEEGTSEFMRKTEEERLGLFKKAFEKLRIIRDEPLLASTVEIFDALNNLDVGLDHDIDREIRERIIEWEMMQKIFDFKEALTRARARRKQKGWRIA